MTNNLLRWGDLVRTVTIRSIRVVTIMAENTITLGKVIFNQPTMKINRVFTDFPSLFSPTAFDMIND